MTGGSQSSSLASTPYGTPVLPPAAAEGPPAAAPPANDKQKAVHRRGRSLSSVFNPLKLGVKGRRTSTTGDDVSDVIGPR